MGEGGSQQTPRVLQWSSIQTLQSDHLASNPIPNIYKLLLLYITYSIMFHFTQLLATHLWCQSKLNLNALMGTGFW